MLITFYLTARPSCIIFGYSQSHKLCDLLSSLAHSVWLGIGEWGFILESIELMDHRMRELTIKQCHYLLMVCDVRVMPLLGVRICGNIRIANHKLQQVRFISSMTKWCVSDCVSIISYTWREETISRISRLL